jgi:hypothetical protein
VQKPEAIAAKPAQEQRERKDPRVQTIGATVLTKQRIAVAHHLELVQITLGNQTLSIHYADAFQLAALIRGHAKQAKKFNGDARKHWSEFSVLTDAEENYRRGF